MNIDEAIEHGRQWVAAGWTWMRGQPAVGPDGKTWIVSIVSTAFGSSPDIYLLDTTDELHCFRLGSVVPDLRDPGFIGHALAQVREAWGDPWITTLRVDSGAPANAGRWCAYGDSRRVLGGYRDTEPEALLAARKAAP